MTGFLRRATHVARTTAAMRPTRALPSPRPLVAVSVADPSSIPVPEAAAGYSVTIDTSNPARYRTVDNGVDRRYLSPPPE